MNGEDTGVSTTRDIPELIPYKDYDVKAAKLRASISWLLTKAYGESRHGDLALPFYDDPQGGSYLKPAVVNGLLSSDTYCRACAKLFKDTAITWKGHQSVIQALSRRGIYVMDTRESAVTENVLSQASPFKVDSHLALIDGLMMAHLSDVVTVPRTVTAVKRFAVFNASSDLPEDAEDSLLLWLNKTCSAVRHYLDAQQAHLPQKQAFGVPVVDNIDKDLNDGCCLAATISFYCPNVLQLHHLALHETVGVADSLFNLQLIREFAEDYCPSNLLHLSINDLFHSPPPLKPNLLVFLAELFHLLEVERPSFVRDTSKPYVSSLVYTGLKGGLQETQESVAEASKTLRIAGSSKPPALIPGVSNATKRSFQQDGIALGSTPDLNKASGNAVSRQPLLPKRLQTESNRSTSRRSHSLTSVEDRATIASSVQAWQAQQAQQLEVTDRGIAPISPALRRELEGEKRDFGLVRTGSLRGSGMSNLTNVSRDSVPVPNKPMLANVSIDSELDLDLTDGSINLGDSPGGSPHRSRDHPVGPIAKQKSPVGPVASAGDRRSQTDLPGKGHPDYLELQSIASSRASSAIVQPTNSPQQQTTKRGSPPVATKEPLIPAQLKPAKEKSNNHHTKEVESGEKLEKKSPSTPNKAEPPKKLGLLIGVVGEGDGARDSSGASTPSEEYQTPSIESVPLPGQEEGGFDRANTRADITDVREGSPTSFREGTPKSGHDGQPKTGREGTHKSGLEAQPKTGREGTPKSGREGTPRTGREGSPRKTGLASGRYSALDRNNPLTQSFTLHNQPTTPEGALAAGIPVVDADVILQRIRSKQSEVGTYSDGSDQEIGKIHADASAREKRLPLSNGPTQSPLPESSPRPGSLNLQKTNSSSKQPRDKPSPKTSFAQIRKQKENGQTAPVIFEKNVDSTVSLQERFNNAKDVSNKPVKKTSFAALPNQTTWQKKAEINNSTSQKTNHSSDPDSLEPLTSELVDIRMRLAERRRQMDNEKRQKEQELSSHRQKVGKQAFIQVISKKEPLNKIVDVKNDVGVEAKDTVAEKVRSKSISPRPTFPVQTQDDSQYSPSPPTKAADDRAKSDSPRTSSSRETSPRSKSFSREHIQSMIDSGRKKWFQGDSTDDVKHEGEAEEVYREQGEPSRDPIDTSGEGEGVREPSPARPVTSTADVAKSSAQRIPQVMTNSMDSKRERRQSEDTNRHGPMVSSVDSGRDRHASSDGSSHKAHPMNAGKSSTYNASLDKLNSSLSELQGEIMRLSLQQDQIKTMVGSDVPADSPPTTVTTSLAVLPADMFYSGRHGVAGEPDVAGSTHHPPYQTYPQQPPPSHVQYPPPHPYPGYQYQPYGQYPPPPPPHPHYQASHLQYPPGPPQYQQPYPPAMPPPQWQSPSHHIPYTSAPVSSSSGHLLPQHSTYHPDMQPASTHTVSSHQSQLHSPTTSSTSMLPREGEPFLLDSTDIMTQTTPMSPPIVSHSIQQSASMHSMSQPHSPQQATPPKMTRSLPADPESSDAAAEGFFVSFDNDTPRKPRPQLGGRRDKSRNRDEMNRSQEGPLEVGVTEGGASPVPTLSAAAVLEAERALNVSPGVGFIIPVEESEAKEEVTELEKKKQKMLEQQKKRREDSERKKLKLEQERVQKRDQERLKQEATDQKKAEEKARRDAIYQQYLERKSERESSEEPASSQGSPAAAPATRRQKNKTRSAPRPKSQPPGSLPSVLPPPPAGYNTPDGSNRVGGFGAQDGNDGPMAYGGLTHRRPPTPDRYMRTHGDENGGPGGDYVGPKLFVKPSQKSNRHIINNAISHCCLAGVVNTDTKNKVLDVMGQADAHHFVILFRDAGMQYKGLYTYNIEREEVHKIHGVGPKQLNHKMFDAFFKYNSGGKNFSKISSTKHLSATIDAVTIHASLWQKKQQVVPAKKPPLLY